MTEFPGVSSTLNRALSAKGYDKLTPVQEAVIDPQLVEADLLVSAQTGSGKTVAFGLAIAPTLFENDTFEKKPAAPLALIIAPTRELALQVKRELQWLYADAGASIASCVGGMDIRTERRALERGSHIVVGTPGRLRDHIMRRALDLSSIRAVVLDEADEMLDLGFKEDLEFMLDAAPEERRTLMFSATVPPLINKLAQNYQRDAVRISTQGEAKQHVDIEYRALVVLQHEKENAIINVLRYYEARNALVFCNTRATVNHMVARLNNRGFSVVALSGELSQNERTHALQAMRDGRARVCVATDVAARGIDLPNLELVVHAELPSNPETLLHRSGRTGRAGKKGVSALIVDPKNRNKAERVLRFAKITAEWANPPMADEVNKRDEERMEMELSAMEGVQPDEERFVDRLTSVYSIQQMAIAYVRAQRLGHSAPEEIQELSIEPPSKDFKKRGKKPHRGRGDKPFKKKFDRSKPDNFENDSAHGSAQGGAKGAAKKSAGWSKKTDDNWVEGGGNKGAGKGEGKPFKKPRWKNRDKDTNSANPERPAGKPKHAGKKPPHKAKTKAGDFKGKASGAKEGAKKPSKSKFKKKPN